MEMGKAGEMGTMEGEGGGGWVRVRRRLYTGGGGARRIVGPHCFFVVSPCLAHGEEIFKKITSNVFNYLKIANNFKLKCCKIQSFITF
jgi:hypothetical protein